MKTASAALSSHIEGEVTTLATCWRIERRDGTVVALTDHDVELIPQFTGTESPATGDYQLGVASGETYSPISSYQRSAIETHNDLSIDNLDAEGILESDAIAESDIRAGLYDNAKVWVFLVNWADLTQGIIRLRRGTWGELSLMDTYYKAEERGLMQELTKPVCEAYTAECLAVLGDARCGIDIEALKETATVSAVTDLKTFSVTGLTQASDYFNYGKIIGLTGPNAGLKGEVKSYTLGSPSEIGLFLNLPYAIQVGDTFDVYPGCDMKLATCDTKFSNVVNFRGFPYMLGRERLMQYGSKTIEQ